MASDDDYMKFLNKVNEDPNAGVVEAQIAQAGSTRAFKTIDADVEIPEVLVEAVKKDAIYTSESDEPFELVTLRWDQGTKTLPSESRFSLVFSWAYHDGIRLRRWTQNSWTQYMQYQKGFLTQWFTTNRGLCRADRALGAVGGGD
jgi:hypothetical protein